MTIIKLKDGEKLFDNVLIVFKDDQLHLYHASEAHRDNPTPIIIPTSRVSYILEDMRDDWGKLILNILEVPK